MQPSDFGVHSGGGAETWREEHKAALTPVAVEHLFMLAV